VNNPLWGSSGQFFLEPEGWQTWNIQQPNIRNISNLVLADAQSKADVNYTLQDRKAIYNPDPRNRNQFFVAFAQFLGHDMGLNPTNFNFVNFAENYKIQILDPTDPLYQPQLGKTGILSLDSSGVMQSNGQFLSFNNNTAFVDLSTVYGSYPSVTSMLRSGVGGRLQTDSTGVNLPFDSNIGTPSECGAFRPGVSAAGDLRADENVVLTTVHTLFAREHNRLAGIFQSANPSWTDEQVFQAAREQNIAQYQNIVFYEFLPLLLGPVVSRMGQYRGYDPRVNPGMNDHFSGAALRVVHDMVALPVLVLDQNCNGYVPPASPPQQEQNNCIPLFFRAVGLEAILRGALNQHAESVDHRLANGIRSVFLQATTPDGNLDVESSNIYRGREHQLRNFDFLKEYHTGSSYYDNPKCSASAAVDSLDCWSLHTSNRTLAAILQSIYGKLSKMDAYIGLITEDTEEPSYFPPVATEMYLEQFGRVRDGDRFWFENRDLHTRSWIHDMKQVQMADIINRNTGVSIGDDERHHNNWAPCGNPGPRPDTDESAFTVFNFCRDLTHSNVTVVSGGQTF
jgi:peroxidase